MKPGAIGKRAAVLAIAAFERTRDTNEFRFNSIGSGTNNGIAVSTHVDEREMGRQVGIRLCASCSDVAGLGIFETRAHAVTKQHVHGWLRAVIVRRLANVVCAKRKIRWQDVLQGFRQSGRRN